jgi:hypothetical protein
MRTIQRLVCWSLVLLVGPAAAPAKEIAESSKLTIPLVRSGSDDDVSGVADFSCKKGRSAFRLRMKNGPPSQEIALLVGGVTRGTFVSSSKGAAKLTLVSGSTLNFDPRGREIELADAGDDRFLRGGGTNTVGGASFDERVNLLSTGIQPTASGYALYRVKNGAGRFKVEIEKVVDGTYEVVVDGVVRGTITTLGGRGGVEFGDDNGGPALDFDPLGKWVQVTRNGDVILSRSLLAGAPGISVCAPAEVTTALTPTAAAPGGSGDARLRLRDNCRRDFRVEIEDVPVGAYDLYVAGNLRGTIQVAVQPDLKVEGEIEFSSELDDSPSQHLPLDFDPAGAPIEVRQGATVFFTATAGTPGTGVCSVVNSELSLTNSGLDGDAKGKARFRQDAACGRDFRVEVERLPAGQYQLNVAGILRGTITVTGTGSDTVGEIEFDTEPTPGKVLLTFDPRGQAVEIRQGTNLYLTVTMPE